MASCTHASSQSQVEQQVGHGRQVITARVMIIANGCGTWATVSLTAGFAVWITK